MKNFILFDIGATNTRVAISHDLRSIVKSVTYKTAPDFKIAILDFKKAVFYLSGKNKISAAAGGIAGPLDQKRQTVVDCNLKGWVKKPIKKAISKTTKSKVLLENDAALAGLGEAAFGAGKKSRIVGYLTISTGVGGAKIVNKKIDAYSFGFEPKKTVIGFNNKTGKPLKLGILISGKEIQKRMHKMPTQIKNPEFWKKTEFNLHLGLINIITLWSPDIMVLGGPIALSPKISYKRLNKTVSAAIKPVTRVPQIVKAKLKSKSGLFGALVLLKNNL
jgi:glucokinase